PSLLLPLSRSRVLSFFFFLIPASTEIYTLSLHDALPISCILQIDCKQASPFYGKPVLFPCYVMMSLSSFYLRRHDQPPFTHDIVLSKSVGTIKHFLYK